jgi:hypothetical protein
MATIDKLPYRKLRQLSRILDASPNSGLSWKGLIEQLPDEFYSPIQVQNFELLSMRQDTSPAFEILSDMGKRGVTIQELRGYFDQMDHKAAKKVLDNHEPLEFHRQSSSDSTWSSFSGGSEPGGGGASAAEIRRRQYSESKLSYSQTSSDSINGVNSSKLSSHLDSPDDYQNHQSGKGTASPTAPPEEPPPPYEAISAVQVGRSFLSSVFIKDYSTVLIWILILFVAYFVMKAM